MLLLHFPYLSCAISSIQFDPEDENPRDLSDKVDGPADNVTIEFVPKDPDDPIQVGGLEVEFCTHPSMFLFLLNPNIP